MMNKEFLQERLHRKNVHKRRQGGGSVSYIKSHQAIREANRAFDFDGWSYTVDLLQRIESQDEKPRRNVKDTCWVVDYLALVTVEVDGVVRQDTGFGQGIDADWGKAHESASKEAVSDGMKRALRTFGDIFGLALYDPNEVNVVSYTQEERSIAVEKINSCESVEELQYFKGLPVDLQSDLKDLALTRYQQLQENEK